MIKKYLVVGNPIEHSLSPKLHNYWLKKNNIEANYDKKKLNKNDLKNIISEVKKEDGLKFDYSANGPNKFFYDVIYNPKETIFLKRAKLFGNRIENGKMMFIYQAHQSFTIWHNLMPQITDETIKLLD